MASPDYRGKREDNRGGSGGSGSGDYNIQGSKRMRPSSPPPPPRGVDRDREPHWEGRPSSRRCPFSPPPPTSSWDRDDQPPRGREPYHHHGHKREEEKPRRVSIPPIVLWFVGDSPTASFF